MSNVHQSLYDYSLLWADVDAPVATASLISFMMILELFIVYVYV